MENQNLSKELIGLEKKYWKAMQDHDLDTALSLTDFPCIVAGPQGARLVDKASFTKMFESHNGNKMKVEFVDEPSVRMLSEDTAVIAYQVCSDMEVDGKPMKMNAVDTSTWIKRSGKWVCGLHTETPLQKQ